MGRATFGDVWLGHVSRGELEPGYITDRMGGGPETCPGGGPDVPG